ncbi:MAG: TIGR00266 family protein, partial [Opitutae bacterium]
METDIQHGPGASTAKVTLAPGEVITSESGAMIAMNGVNVETTTHKRNSGSIFGGLKRMIGGESFFLNHYTAYDQGGEVWLATTLAGDMAEIEVEPSTKIVVQSGSYVASEQGVDVGLDWQGFKSLFAKEGLFWINMSGQGKAIINSFGAIYS